MGRIDGDMWEEHCTNYRTPVTILFFVNPRLGVKRYMHILTICISLSQKRLKKKSCWLVDWWLFVCWCVCLFVCLFVCFNNPYLQP